MAASLFVLWNYALYFSVERRRRPKIAVVKFGRTERLTTIDQVNWIPSKRPRFSGCNGCAELIADFSADIPPEWEAFVADSALSGQIVYQVRQLSESLTGRVELDHLSKNSFGSLLPTRAWFHLKSGLPADQPFDGRPDSVAPVRQRDILVVQRAGTVEPAVRGP